MSKRALILGISGQDGAYLAQLLLSKGYVVHGTSRDAENQAFKGLKTLGIREQISVHSASLHDFRNLLNVITEVQPNEIYNLSGQSSVGLSFSQPMESFESIASGTIQLLEVLRFLNANVRLYNACSSECFGETTPGTHCSESNPFRPKSPYAMAKATAFWTTQTYREAYRLYVCSGILFNHDSPLRPTRFVTSKIVSAAVRIARGQRMRLELGNLDVWRDWGYAQEYVEAMWLMLQQPQPDDYVIATGESHSLQEFLERCFREVDLDWTDHVDVNPALFRPFDLAYSGADPAKAKSALKWQAQTTFDALIPLLVKHESHRQAEQG